MAKQHFWQSVHRRLYFPLDHPTMPGWFKAWENIIHKCSLWPEKGLNAKCPRFKCVQGHTGLLLAGAFYFAKRICLTEVPTEEHITATGPISVIIIQNFTVN